MAGNGKKRLRYGLVAAGAMVLGYLVLVLLTPTFGRVVGYANEQPRLQVVQPEPASSPAEVDRVRRLAKLVFDDKPQLATEYWPEPGVIREQRDCWLVQFARKVPIYQFLGFKQVVPPSDRLLSLSIDKKDYAVRVGNWCH